MMIEYNNKQFLHWLERLRAIRRLPPDTDLPFKTIEAKELLHDLTTLPEAVDPARWLMAQQPTLISRILLWQIVSCANIIRQAKTHDGHSPYAKLGQKTALPIEEICQTLPDSPWVFSDAVIRQIETLLRTDVQISEPDHDDLYLRLFIDLLQRPANLTLRAWVADSYLDLAAWVTIKWIVTESIPTSWTHWQSLPNAQTLFASSTNEAVSVKLTHLKRGDAGFIVEGLIEIAKTLNKRVGKGSIAKWESLVRINDDLGHSYVVCSQFYEGGTTKPWRGDSYSVGYYCYPPISPQANQLELTFVSPTVFVKQFHEMESKTAVSIPTEQLYLVFNVR